MRISSLCVLLLACSLNAKEPNSYINPVGMRFQLLEAGTFRMGSPKSERRPAFPGSASSEDEGPRHQVKIRKSFFLARTEVTQGQWKKVMGTDLHKMSGSSNVSTEEIDSQFPMIYLTWYDAIAFCNALSEKEKRPPYYKLTNIERKEKSASIGKATVTILGGEGYRLPTEAEWEYACRAGTETAYAFGKRLKEKDARTSESLAKVGTHRQNDWGLFDMHGNVYEWCQDWYGGKYYAESPKVDPQGPKEGRRRVIRGGAYQGLLNWCRSANRTGNSPGSRTNFIGFRVARSPGKKAE